MLLYAGKTHNVGLKNNHYNHLQVQYRMHKQQTKEKRSTEICLTACTDSLTPAYSKSPCLWSTRL